MKISHALVIAAVCLATAVVAEATTQAPSKKQLIVMAEAAVKKQLRDPQSGQFEILGYAKGDAGSLAGVCGTVNAKNGFGGYEGAHPFLYMLGRTPADNRAVIVDGGPELTESDLRGNAAMEAAILRMLAIDLCKPEKMLPL